MDEESLKFKNTDFDFLLKQKVVEWLDLGINKSVEGDLKGFFEGMKKIHGLIAYYNYSSKQTLLDLESTLHDHFINLGAARPNRRDQILLANKEKRSLLYLLDFYFSEIIKAYSELGLWFNTKVEVDNFDLLLSEENFNDESDGLSDKKKYLSQLSNEAILSLLSANMVNEVYARAIVKSVFKGGFDV